MIIDKLRDDDHYYGEFGKQFLSNSDIGALLTNPLEFHQDTPNNINFVVGGYFHTCILEPHKIDTFIISQAPDRRTKIYKQDAGGDIVILQKEVDNLLAMKAKILDDPEFAEYVINDNVEYEVPGIINIKGETWKGKADIINHTLGLIVDLKTTGRIEYFHESANKFNYDSQAYIYQKMFGYPLVFLAIDKKSHEIVIFDCSKDFLKSGETKVLGAIEVYKENFNN